MFTDSNKLKNQVLLVQQIPDHLQEMYDAVSEDESNDTTAYTIPLQKDPILYPPVLQAFHNIYDFEKMPVARGMACEEGNWLAFHMTKRAVTFSPLDIPAEQLLVELPSAVAAIESAEVQKSFIQPDQQAL